MAILPSAGTAVEGPRPDRPVVRLVHGEDGILGEPIFLRETLARDEAHFRSAQYFEMRQAATHSSNPEIASTPCNRIDHVGGAPARDFNRANDAIGQLIKTVFGSSKPNPVF